MPSEFETLDIVRRPRLATARLFGNKRCVPKKMENTKLLSLRANEIIHYESFTPRAVENKSNQKSYRKIFSDRVVSPTNAFLVPKA